MIPSEDDDMAVLPRDYGTSGWCDRGNHDRCAHRAGGPHEHGVYSPPTFGYRPDSGAMVTGFVTGTYDPARLWQCSCPCHGRTPAAATTEPTQLDLFAGAA